MILKRVMVGFIALSISLSSCSWFPSAPDSKMPVDTLSVTQVLTAIPPNIPVESISKYPTFIVNGAELVVNWTYFDEYRIGLEYTVTGNFAPEGYSIYCPVDESKLTTTVSGISFYPYQWDSQQPINDQSTFTCTALIERQKYQITQTFDRTDRQKVNTIPISLSISVGGFDARNENGEIYPIPETTFNDLSIEIPLELGLTFEIDQLVEKDGVAVHFQRFDLNPSVSFLYFCIDSNNHKEWEMNLSTNWKNVSYPADVPYRIGLGDNIDLTYAQVLTEKRCYRIPFVFQFDGQAGNSPTRKLTINFLSMKINYLEPPTQEDCHGNLQILQHIYPGLDFSCSIEDLNQQGYKFSLLINQLPPNLDEETAHQLIEESFIKTIPLGITQDILVP